MSPHLRAWRGAAPQGRVLGCTAVGSQQQPPAPPLQLEEQKGPHLLLGQVLCSHRPPKIPFCLEVVKEKPSPPKQLVLQLGKTWLEKVSDSILG